MDTIRFARIAEKIATDARSARIAALLCADVERKWEPPKGDRREWRRKLPDGTYEYRDTPPEQGDGKKPDKPQPDKALPPEYKNHVTLGKPQLEKTLSKGHYTIMSGGRNSNDPKEEKMEPTDEFFHKRHEELRGELEKAGVKYTECVGNYFGKESSFMVFHDPQELTAKTAKSIMVHHKDRDELKSHRKFLEGLGKKFNQNSVLHGSNGTNRMVFTTGKLKGKVCGGKGWKEVPEAENLYTDIDLKKNDHTKFSLDLKTCFEKKYL
jgi:hypothetical protein